MKEIIREQEIKTLEFNAIRLKLAELAATPMGRDRALALMPSAEKAAVERRLKETGEGRMLCAGRSFTVPAVAEIEPLVTRAAKGGLLKGAELASVAAFIGGVRRWQQLFRDEESRRLYPLLYGYVYGLDGCAGLARELARCLDMDGNVLDDASPLLAALRRQHRGAQEKIREKLDSFLRSPAFQKYLQDPLITIRNGRYVLPVKQEHRYRVEGVLHDQSASGATLFIEPLPVVRLQNELAALQNRADQEIERILYQLSAGVAGASAALLSDREIYAALDLAVACGRLSLELRGVEPELAGSSEPRLLLVEARHPLLPGPAVPLSVSMGGENRVLVVTGPNTGGKTVALKTIGLLAIMAQSGLHLPAEAGTELFVFDCIRADIGDEQSILQSLSTFSAHFKNIISILDEAGPHSLVLFDELGAGTDPSEGAALAMAILDSLSRRGSLAAATTHINELKLFAQVRAGMQNAAMAFDLETLSPTYRLMQGVPGQSNAFIIAAKLGLPETVLEQARGFLRREHAEVESVIASLVEDRRRLSQDSREAARDRARAELLLRELDEEREKLRARREDILNQAREEARAMVRRTKHTVDGLIRELQQLRGAAGDDALHRAEGIRQALHDLRRAAEADLEPEEEPAPLPEEPAPGQTVQIYSLRRKGELIAVSGAEAQVQVGPIRVQVPLHDLREWKDRGAAAEAPARAAYTLQKNGAVRAAVDLRGKTVDESMAEVEKFLDDALWAGLKRVTVIHGRGTGKLKEGLRAYLREHRLVKELRGGVPGEGGDGVTIVTLDTGGGGE